MARQRREWRPPWRGPWLLLASLLAARAEDRAPEARLPVEEPLAAEERREDGGRRLQIDAKDLVKDTALLSNNYMHVHYSFNLQRLNMHREGTGELFLSFQDGNPRMRLKGAARSPRFGDGEITIVVDSSVKTMYVLFKLEELHEAQCVQYPFPRIKDRGARMDRLRWRKEQVMKWQSIQAQNTVIAPKMLQVNWTKSNKLEFLFGQNNEVAGVDLVKGSRVVKTIRIQGAPEEKGKEDLDSIFGPPAPHCTPASDVVNPPARVELIPPHRKSSALNDFLLVLADDSPGGWPQLFVVLSAITVPGDVAVMIEDPEPPNHKDLPGLAFDYTAEVVSRGVRHTSSGSIWLNLREKSFRLRGEAKETKVGPLYMDLIARGGDSATVYANVNLTVQEEHQCVSYDYPVMNGNSTRELQDISHQGLSFFAIAELDGEDCGIFVAPLARGRWIHIWVDLESDTPNAILRSEIHRSGQVLRSTSVKGWHVANDKELALPLTAPKEWACSKAHATGQLARLGLHKVHKRSVELQDALYSLRELEPSFAVLEILGLTGDVAIMVQEPELPELWRLASVSFSYSLYLGPADGDPRVGGHTYTAGSFAADLQHGKVRVTAGAMTPGATNVSLALNPGMLAVQVEEASLSEPQCLILPLEGDKTTGTNDQDDRFNAAGIFDGVEVIGQAECNRFTFLGTGAHAESVEFWFSKEENNVCGIEVLPPAGDDGSGVGALINVPAWEPIYAPGARDGDPYGTHLAAAPDGWKCKTVSDQEREGGGLWLSLASEMPADNLPAAVALTKLAEASGVVGLLPPRASNTLSRLVIMSPSSFRSVAPTTPPPPAPPVNIFGPELRSFAFSFASTYPSQGRSRSSGVAYGSSSSPRTRNHGSGELRVDLANRRLYLRSEAINVSAGIPRVESRVIFRGDRGRLYARTKMENEGMEQCWSVRTVEAVPPPHGGVQPNPFSRGQLAGKGFSVPGAAGEQAEKYVFYLNQRKRVELFVDEQLALAAMNLDDLNRDVSAGILVRDWSTAPIDVGWFEPSDDWKCEDLQFLEYAEHIAEWDLIRVFFPVEPVPLLNEVPHGRPVS